MYDGNQISVGTRIMLAHKFPGTIVGYSTIDDGFKDYPIFEGDDLPKSDKGRYHGHDCGGQIPSNRGFYLDMPEEDYDIISYPSKTLDLEDVLKQL